MFYLHVFQCIFCGFILCCFYCPGSATPEEMPPLEGEDEDASRMEEVD